MPRISKADDFVRRLSAGACRLVALMIVSGSELTAQSSSARPSAAAAQAILQSRPDLVSQLRQRFVNSGLTREQVHARLRAEGYPENLLDAYLPGTTGTAAEPTADVFRAVGLLGIADTADISALQNAAGVRTTKVGRDSAGGILDTNGVLFLDTLRNARSAADSARIIAAVPDSGFRIFGLDLFRASSTQFDPNVSGPVDDRYRVNSGDRLVLILTGDVEASYDLPVTREGFIVIPQVGQIPVANLTIAQLDAVLTTRLARVYSGVRTNNQGTTRFSISVARLRSNQIIVTGDVQRPASYVISSVGTALTALYAAGGPTRNGSFRNIRILRGGRLVDSLDVYDYLLRGDASHDARLESGDVVFVPVHGRRARIVGEIERPATYELKSGEQLSDLLRAAGGFRATASRQRVLIERISPPDARGAPGSERITVDVSAASLAGVSGAAVPVQDGDVVRVFAVAERVRNRIAVAGNVYQPGSQGFTAGMRLSEALRRAGGLQPDTYLGQVLITRLNSDSTRRQLRAILADTLGNVIADPALQEDDQITVFSVTTFRPQRTVSIGGAVRNPGQFPYRQGITLRDLVLLAGGVHESAYLREAEIARLPTDRSNGRTAVTIRVPLDSTYLFERKPNGDYPGVPGLPASSAGAPEVLLDPYDNALILRQPDWELQRTVVLQGEVKFPGTYALERKTERLSDLVEHAGGLTNEAYADGIVFLRSQNGIGRVGVDLGAAMRTPESADNLILRNGDYITIPPYNAVVTIRGAVNQPSTIAYVGGKDINFYIRAAGGAARNGDAGRAFVVQPSGKLEAINDRPLFLPSSLPRPRAGSVVTVPEIDPADRRDYIALVGTVAQIIASTVAIIVALRR